MKNRLFIFLALCLAGCSDHKEAKTSGDIVSLSDTIQEVLAQPDTTEEELVWYVGDSTLGIGGITSQFERREVHSISKPDTIPIMGKGGNKQVGWLTHKTFSYSGRFAKIKPFEISDPEILAGKQFSQQDWHAGIVEIEFLRVYALNERYGQIFKQEYPGHEMWIDLSALDASKGRFFTWKQYFLRFPNGGAWEHGYNYVGKTPLYLSEEPGQKKESIPLEPLPPNGSYEIYLTGKSQGNWVEVVVNEVIQHFGEMYYEKTEVLGKHRGWMPAVDKDGYPLLDEIVLGC